MNTPNYPLRFDSDWCPTPMPTAPVHEYLAELKREADASTVYLYPRDVLEHVEQVRERYGQARELVASLPADGCERYVEASGWRQRPSFLGGGI